MVNYSNGKIYKIISDQTDLIYIGSTTQQLSKRKQRHKSNKDCSSKEILQYEDARIILIEMFSCNCKEELSAREQYFMDKFKADGFNLVNKNRVIGRDFNSKSNYDKQYYHNNKETLNNNRIEYHREYRNKNKERVNLNQNETRFFNTKTRVLEVYNFIQMINQY